VLRGGCFFDNDHFIRCAFRSYYSPNFRYDGYLGFRVVLRCAHNFRSVGNADRPRLVGRDENWRRFLPSAPGNAGPDK
jgi:hypothetical protein